MMAVNPVVLLLGATGQIGKLIAEQLCHNRLIRLVVATRRQDKLNDLEKIYGHSTYIDLDDPRTFPNALKDVNRLFLLTGYSVAMLAQSKAIIDVAKKAGVGHITHLGVFSPEWDCTDPHFGWHQMIEVYIKHSQLKWTFLHPNCFLQNLTAFSLIKNGKFRWYTDKPCGWIALEDVAEAAAKILIEGPTTHHEKDYWFSTEALNLYEVAKVLTEVTERNIIADLQPAEQFLKDMGAESQTFDPYFYSVAESFKQIQDGRMSYIGNVTDDIQILLNRKGLSLDQWANKHKRELIDLLDEQAKKGITWG